MLSLAETRNHQPLPCSSDPYVICMHSKDKVDSPRLSHTSQHSTRQNSKSDKALGCVMQSTNFDLEFVHINCQSLAASVRDEAQGWVQALSQCMQELDCQTLEVSANISTSCNIMLLLQAALLNLLV